MSLRRTHRVWKLVVIVVYHWEDGCSVGFCEGEEKLMNDEYSGAEVSVGKRFMAAAIDAAREGIGQGQTPFGACVVRGDEIIAATHNEVWQRCDATAHAEVVAIRAACEKLGTIDLSACEIYSTCEPCPMCFAACHWARIGRIVFGASIADAKAAGFSEMEISNESMKALGPSAIVLAGGFMRDECTELFSIWKSAADARVY